MVVSKYEKAAEVCESKKKIKRELNNDELKYLRALDRTNLFYFIKNKFLYANEICMLNEGAPPLKTLISLKHESNKIQEEFLDNFIELISTSYSSDMFFDYLFIEGVDINYLDGIPFFKEPFDLSPVTNKILEGHPQTEKKQ